MKGRIKEGFWAVLAAGVLTLLAGLGVLAYPDLAADDALYQSRSAPDGEIVLVGIDQRALEEIGPYDQWGRDVMAMVLESLNESEETRPAAIALDILYTNDTAPDADAWLTEAAGRYGNVITAAAAQFGTSMAEGAEGEYTLDKFSVLAYETPYATLRDVTTQGHINVMLDETDGILRHHLLKFRLPDGTEVPSLALAAAEKYWAYHGEESPALPATDARGFWYLPFCGKPGDFDESISVASVLSGEIPAEYFKGKIVLIGPYAPALQDNYFTAAAHAQQMYGVEVHANAIQALLWRNYKREAGNSLQLAILFFVLLTAFLCFWKRKVSLATLLCAAYCGGWVLLCVLLYRQGYVLHVLWVPAGVLLLYIGCIAYNYVCSAMEKQRITGITGRRHCTAKMQQGISLLHFQS